MLGSDVDPGPSSSMNPPKRNQFTKIFGHQINASHVRDCQALRILARDGRPRPPQDLVLVKCALAFIQPISSAKPPNARKEGSRYLLFALVSSFAATPPVVCVADLSFWRVR